MNAEADRFKAARTLEGQLNDRQRRVLDLLVAGRTNGEIGDELGMTLDGAKWNVSEILGKLGLQSREEAADYWRWRKRSRVPMPNLRGLATISALKWAGGVSAVAVLGLVLVGLLARSDDKSSGELLPFYLEARMIADDNSRSVGTNVAGGAGSAAEHRVTEIRWWNQDLDHARIEIETREPQVQRGTDVIVVGGGEQIYYREQANTYTITPLYDFPPEAKLRLRPWSFSALIGPWYTEVASLDDLVRQLRGFYAQNDPPGSVEVIGHERVLGVETMIVETSPAVSSSGSDGSVSGTGSIRYWIDPERLVVLRIAIDQGETGNYEIEVVRLDWDAKIAADKFRFSPPRGAQQLDSSNAAGFLDGGNGTYTSSGPLGQTVVAVPPGMFRLGYLPDGMTVKGTEGEEPQGGRIVFFAVTYGDGLGKTFVVEQRFRPGGLSDSFPRTDPVALNGLTVFRSRSGDEIAYTWAIGDLVITVRSATVGEAELRAIAESLELVP